jgi:outer membrane protein
MRAATLTVILATSLTCHVAAADVDEPGPPPPGHEVTPSGPRLALRSGVAVPFGPAYTASGALSDTITGYVPLRVDVGYRIARRFYIGANAELATILPNQCPAGASCSGTHIRFGVMAAYHYLPASLVDPWIGVGMGYERLTVSRTVDGTTGEISASGLELVDLELGMDLRLWRSFRFGPVVSGALGQYTRIAINGVPTSDFDAAPHAWVLVGLRGAYDL